jgi:hypothetical protein
MGIHFRSRIENQQLKPTVAGSGSGWCCSSGGVVSNRTLCQGGVFILGGTNNSFCPQTAPCITGFVGTNGACCYWSKNDGKYIQVCENTDSAIECAEKNEGLLEGLYSNFTPGGSCVEQGGEVVCNGIQIPNGAVELNNRESISTQELVLGHCCSSNNCTKTIEQECKETWIPPFNTELYSCDTNICDGILRSQSLRSPPRTTKISLNTATNPLLILPEIGEYYQGGIFIGVYNTGTSIESTVFGNINSGNATPYKARAGNTYNTFKNWILIANDIDLEKEQPFNTLDESRVDLNISYGDGLFNTENNTETELFKFIKNYKKNGFTDWYLPSQDELAFYFNNIKYDTPIYKNANLKDGIYLSSTGFKFFASQKINSTYYNYSQSANIDSYGQVSLVNRNSPVKIRLFRRIYLY